MNETLSLKELMNPVRLDMQARFNNAQIAVDMSYRLAEKQVWIDDTKTVNPDWKEGDPTYDKMIHTSATAEQKTAELVRIARIIKTEIEKDLNDTLKILEVKNEGAQSPTPILS
jgi:hypothetical protein